MRFVLAIVSFVIGLLLVALAVGQRTVFAPPSSLVADSSTTSSAPVTVIPGSTLNANPGYQRINVSGSGKVFAAYGKTADVDAWVGDAEHTTLRFDAESAKLVGKTTGSEASVPSPKGSDLWYQEYDGSGQFTVRLPQDVSVLIVSDGAAAAPSDVSVTWPKDTATPSVGPLLVAGGVFALGGIVLLVLAFLHQRRGRGPRRAAAAGAQVPTRGRRGSRAFIAVPVVLVGTLALAGCSSDYWPQGGDPSLATPTPTASATGAAETTEPTAATKQQITRVVERIATVAKQSDGARDRDLAKTRFTGAALDLRLANYSIRGKDSDAKAPPAISAGQVCVALPQQTDTWPRTVFVIVAEDCDAKSAPQALTLVQDTARDPYKVAYDVSLEADAKIPSLAPTSIGAALLAPQSKLLAIAPDQVATAYGDILSKDSKSEYADLFATEGDGLRTTIGKAYKDKKAKSLPDTAKIEYSSEAPEDSAVAIATDDAGALVSADLNEIEKVTPTASGAEVNTEGAVKALSGVDTSKKGISATYGVQLLFYVPPVASDDKVVLLGFTQGLTAASEVQ